MTTLYTLPSDQTILLGVIGFIGVFSTAIILTSAFRKNRLGNRKWQ